MLIGFAFTVVGLLASRILFWKFPILREEPVTLMAFKE